jgi:hypothetical protein
LDLNRSEETKGDDDDDGMWCFDVSARVERGGDVTSQTLKHCAMERPRKEEETTRDAKTGRFEFGKMSDANDAATPGRAFALRFGSGKTTHEAKIGDVKAIFGKFVREGKMTVETKDGTRVLVRGSPGECARLMKTLTTMKSQPTEARQAYLRGLQRCATCAGKCEANERKMAERQDKAAAAAAAAAEASAEKRRRRETEEVERRAAKESKLEDQLRALEEKKLKVESTKAEIASLKIDIEGERDALRREKESIVQRRRELEDERRLLERQSSEAAEERAKMESQRKLAEIEGQRLAEEKARNVDRARELAEEKERIAKLERELEEDRERLAFMQKHQKNDELQAQRVREEASRRAQARAQEAQKRKGKPEAMSPGSFYGKKKAKIVIDDDDDSDDSSAEKENEKATNEAEDARRKERIAKLRKAELERQLKEKLAREELGRRQAEAQQKKEAARRAQMDSKLERERKARQEEEARSHQKWKSQQAEQIRKNSRANSVPTATKAMWESHLTSLENLKSRAVGSLCETDIPWPPAHNIAFFAGADGLHEKKKKVTKATLSWHPDKFEQKYGKLLKESEAQKIRTRVAALSSQFIELRQALNAM